MIAALNWYLAFGDKHDAYKKAFERGNLNSPYADKPEVPEPVLGAWEVYMDCIGQLTPAGSIDFVAFQAYLDLRGIRDPVVRRELFFFVRRLDSGRRAWLVRRDSGE